MKSMPGQRSKQRVTRRPRVPLPRQRGGAHEDKTKRPFRQRKHKKKGAGNKVRRSPESAPAGSTAPCYCLSHDGLEPLHSPAPVRLGDVEIALGVDGDGMSVREVADLVSGSAETREDLTALVVKDMELLIAAVHHVQMLLLFIR